MEDLIVEKLEPGDILVYNSGLRLKVYTTSKIINVKIKDKKEKITERYNAIRCLMAEIDKPLMRDKNGDPIPGIKTFEICHCSYRTTKDDKINLGTDIKEFIPANVIDYKELQN